MTSERGETNNISEAFAPPSLSAHSSIQSTHRLLSVSLWRVRCLAIKLSSMQLAGSDSSLFFSLLLLLSRMKWVKNFLPFYIKGYLDDDDNPTERLLSLAKPNH